MDSPYAAVEATIAKRLRPAQKSKYFLAVASAHRHPDDALRHRLEHLFGSLEITGTVYSFSQFSDYYDAELGGKVWKYLIGFETLLPSESLVEIKHRVERLQWETARSSANGLAREFNLDPGYVNAWQMVLATVKNRSHRLYLGEGVYGEVTLQFRKGEFHPLPWTYPDYREAPVLLYAAYLRRRYLEQTTGSVG